MNDASLHTESGLLIATGYERVVHGGHGDYVEIAPNQIVEENIKNPFYNPNTIEDAYYVQYRSNDYCNIKIYHQKRTVKYADYRIGFYYISVFDLPYFSEKIGIKKFV